MVKKKCLLCGKEFKAKNWRKDFAKYCSKRCRWNSRIGMIPWNKGKKGLQTAWNKGITGSESHLNHPKSDEHKRKIGLKSKARMNSPENKEKYRQIKLEYWAKKKAGIAPALG